MIRETIVPNGMILEGLTKGQYSTLSAEVGAISTKVKMGADGGSEVSLDHGKVILYDERNAVKILDEVDIDTIEYLRALIAIKPRGGNQDRKESKIVEISSKEELGRFLMNFSDGGGIGIERVGNRYFVYTPDEKVELIYSPRNTDYTLSDFRSQIALYSFSPKPERKSSIIKLFLGHQ